MEENFYKKSLSDINIKKEENDLKIKELDEIRKVFVYNNLETKTAIRLAGMMFPCFIIMIALLFGAGPFIASFIPAKVIPYLFMGLSTVLSIINEKYLDKKSIYTEKYKELTKNKNATEIKEIETLNEIEYNKAINRRNIFNETIKLIEYNKNMHDILSKNYKIEIKNSNNNEISNNINRIKKELDDSYKELDKITTRNYLTKKYWSIRENYQKKLNPLVNGLMSGLLAMLLIFGLSAGIRDLMAFKTVLGSISYTLAPLIGVSLVTGIASKKEYKSDEKAFNKIINDINDQELKKKIDIKEEEMFNMKESELIDHISKLENELFEQIRINEYVKETIDNEYNKTKEYENTKTDAIYLDGPTLDKKLD